MIHHFLPAWQICMYVAEGTIWRGTVDIVCTKFLKLVFATLWISVVEHLQHQHCSGHVPSWIISQISVSINAINHILLWNRYDPVFIANSSNLLSNIGPLTHAAHAITIDWLNEGLVSIWFLTSSLPFFGKFRVGHVIMSRHLSASLAAV